MRDLSGGATGSAGATPSVAWGRRTASVLTLTHNSGTTVTFNTSSGASGDMSVAGSPVDSIVNDSGGSTYVLVTVYGRIVPGSVALADIAVWIQTATESLYVPLTQTAGTDGDFTASVCMLLTTGDNVSVHIFNGDVSNDATLYDASISAEVLP